MNTTIVTYNIEQMAELAAKESNEIITNGYLNEQAVLLISGQPKSRKTFLVMNLAISLALGRSFASFNIPKPKKVLMISTEGGGVSNSKRITKMHQAIATKTEVDLTGKLEVAFKPHIWLNIEDEKNNLKGLIEKVRPEVLILDPLINFHNVNENAANEMGAIFSCLRELIEEYNLSIILLHHHGKSELQGARGSSVIEGAYDSSIAISPSTGGDIHKLKMIFRHNESPNDISLKFDSDTFWFENTLHLVPDSAILFLREKGKVSKKVWVANMVRQGISKSSAYEKIDNYVVKGIVTLENKYYQVA